MQKILYCVIARSPLHKRRMGVVGLGAEDTTWLLGLLPPGFKGAQRPYRLPETIGGAVYERLFGEGIPEGCCFDLLRLRQPLR